MNGDVFDNTASRVGWVEPNGDVFSGAADRVGWVETGGDYIELAGVAGLLLLLFS